MDKENCYYCVSVVAEWIRRWRRRAAIVALLRPMTVARSADQKVRMFEPRLGKRVLCTYDLHRGLALLTLNSHTLHDTVTTARLLP